MHKLVKNNTLLKLAVFSFALLFMTAVFLFLSPTVLAQSSPADTMAWGNFESNFQDSSGLGNLDIRIVAANIIRVLLGFMGIIAVILIIYSGWLWMASAGDESRITRAKQTLVAAMVGIVIILMSFAIVSFVLNRLQMTIGSGGPGPGPGPWGPGIGITALGNCSLVSVYPEDGQGDVPRNTGIIITFREEVNTATIRDATNNILTDRVKIFESSERADCLGAGPCTSQIMDVTVYTNDNMTFFLDPVNYLGSPSQNMEYMVYLSNDITKLDGMPVFKNCHNDFALWSFGVSNKLDLTPSQVLSGVFPPPDNAIDTESGALAVQATGSITVIGQPEVYTPAGHTSVNAIGPSTPAATAVIAPNNQQSGNLTITVLGDGIATPFTAQMDNTGAPLGAANFIGNTAAFPGILTLTVPGGPGAGSSWLVTGVTAEIQADVIIVGSSIFVFGTSIVSDSNTAVVAGNIVAALAGHQQVTAIQTGSVVDITAIIAGAAGNNIRLEANNILTFGPVVPMAGGLDDQVIITVRGGARDVPRNAVVQVNFNEAINPITVSGNAADVASYIRVINMSNPGVALGGQFIVSNGYRTVEFISDNLCGVNGCGEQIYCLPELSNIRVELVAATLAGCGADNCAGKSPYTICNVAGVCEDAGGINYPLSSMPFNGVADVALNSLDGNRNDEAVGPIDYYNENPPPSPNGQDINFGDSFQWSFYVSDIIDLTPPEIDAGSPNPNPFHNATGVLLPDPLMIEFTKLMLSSSLTTGSRAINTGNNTIIHQYINLETLTVSPVGYWIRKTDIDDLPTDGIADRTRVEINHSRFAPNIMYRAQIGSGVKDIFQNCFNPSSSATCVGGPSCCGEASMAACP